MYKTENITHIAILQFVSIQAIVYTQYELWNRCLLKLCLTTHDTKSLVHKAYLVHIHMEFVQRIYNFSKHSHVYRHNFE